jgi:hypothetical protein
VEDGAVHVSSGEPGFLMTTTEYGDFELHVEFRAPADTNSGIFLRTSEDARDPGRDCYELNIAPRSNPFPTGSFVARSKWPAQEGTPALDDGQWHTFDIRAEGPRITVDLDGERVQDYVDDSPIARGKIGLQLNQGAVAFHNIRLRPLGLESIFNGRDLAGWNTDRAEASRFEVSDEGELRVLDGRGQLESDGRYGDFILQLECRVDADGLNSGVFFRCIPGDFMMGYECQIHNGMQGGDPTRPQDCGTGGIFRRQDARRIVARDREWFALTLAANGPHMAAWVDGYPVSDWTDTRPPDENPRLGQRLEAGTLAIQGHDPTTDLRFRKIQVIELPRPRK